MLVSYKESWRNETPPISPKDFCGGWEQRLAHAVVTHAIRDFFLTYKLMLSHLDKANALKEEKDKAKEMAAVEKHFKRYKKMRIFFASPWCEALLEGEVDGKSFLRKIERAVELRIAQLDKERKEREEKGLRKLSKKKAIRCSVCGQYFVPFSLTAWELSNVKGAKYLCQECLDVITSDKANRELSADIDLSDYEREVDEW